MTPPGVLPAKRRGSVARAAPDLAEILGAEFAGLSRRTPRSM
ncbi:hypothetical protein [Microbispora sp. CA-102843]